LNSLLGRAKTFLEQDLWEIDLADQRWWRRFLWHQGQLWSVVLRDFIADNCLLRASALTFTTLLSVVPLLALMFSVLKGFGVQNTLEPLLLNNLAVGSRDVVTLIIKYINNTNVGRLGTFGLLFLIITVLTLLSNIEKSFNQVWGVEETRSLLRRFTDYFSVVTIAPIFLVVAISMTSTVKSQTFVQGLLEKAYVGELILLLFQILPFMFMWLVFAGLYLFMPNIKVSPRAALIGGICGGTIWQFSQWFYLYFQVGVAKYNAIYGTMAALPIFMFWIYLSWAIVLFGLEVTYATQNLQSIRQNVRGSSVNFESRELIALTVMLFLAGRFFRGEEALSLEEIAVKLSIPPRFLRDVMEELRRLGYVSEVAREPAESGYQPARALDTLTVHEIFQGLSKDGVNYDHGQEIRERAVVGQLARRMNQAGEAALAGMTLRDLVEQAGQEQSIQAVEAGS
jgi:membrane protein